MKEIYTPENEFDDNIANAAARIENGMPESAREWLRQGDHLAFRLMNENTRIEREDKVKLFDMEISLAREHLAAGEIELARSWLELAADDASILGWTLIHDCVRKEIADLSEAR